jgi:uncharacterized protein (DUF2062 family)
MINWFKRGIKFRLIKLMRIKDKTKRIARGFAWGSFLAIWPSMPFNTILSLLMAPLFGGNRIAAVIGSWIVGPFVVAPFYYYFSYLTGKILFSIFNFSVQKITFEQMEKFLYSYMEHPLDNTFYYFASKQGFTILWDKIDGFFWAMEIGGLILGSIGAFIAYKSVSFIQKWFIKHKEYVIKYKKLKNKNKPKN